MKLEPQFPCRTLRLGVNALISVASPLHGGDLGGGQMGGRAGAYGLSVDGGTDDCQGHRQQQRYLLFVGDLSSLAPGGQHLQGALRNLRLTCLREVDVQAGRAPLGLGTRTLTSSTVSPLRPASCAAARRETTAHQRTPCR